MRLAARHILTFALLAALSACAHVIPADQRAKADPTGDLATLRSNPQENLGKTLLLGGLIVDTKYEEDLGTLELLSYRLDRWGEPIAVDDTGERFLVRSEQFIDPALYLPGRMLTLTGTFEGLEEGEVQRTPYSYPVLLLEASHLWETPFRHGITAHPNIYAPYYVRPDSPLPPNPYDPGYAPYPYTQHTIRPPGTH